MGWDWPRLLTRYQQNHPDRFELAILVGGSIGAVALGKPARNRAFCWLDYVEASPDPPRALKGLTLSVVFTALEQYCVVLGGNELRLANPLPALIPLYRDRYGFKVASGPGGSPYCWREVVP